MDVPEKGDDRILGSVAFVSQLLSEVDLAKKYRWANIDREKAAFEVVAQYCQENEISSQALGGGCRIRKVSKARNELAHKLTEKLDLSFAEIARLLGVSTSAITKIFSGKTEKS